MSIKDLVKDNMVTFDSYRQGLFYYNIIHVPLLKGDTPSYPTADVYQFTVPIDDIGTATLLGEDKAITFMRWIRKAMQDGTITKNGRLLGVPGEVS